MQKLLLVVTIENQVSDTIIYVVAYICWKKNDDNKIKTAHYRWNVKFYINIYNKPLYTVYNEWLDYIFPFCLDDDIYVGT